MGLRTFCLALAVALLASGSARAHPADWHGGFVIELHAARHADFINLLVRVPLELLTGVGLPLRGDRLVDTAAFRRADPIAADGRTYEDRAVSAVAKAFRLEQAGGAISLRAKTARLSAGGDAAFHGYREARAHLAADASAIADAVDARDGFLDIHFVGAVDGGPVLFVPSLGSAVGSAVTFHIARGDGEATVMLAGDGPPRQVATGEEVVPGK